MYLAGDGAGIAGADAAERSGERAALALLEDRGLAVERTRASRLERQLKKTARFRTLLERAFPFPAHWIDRCADSTVVCRCEEIDAGTIREAAQGFGLVDVNRLKALSRIGMGRCQGRVCGVMATEMLASIYGRHVKESGRLRTQAPIKPIPLASADDAD